MARLRSYSSANEIQNQEGYRISEGEIDLRELFVVIWDGKWVILAITTVFTIFSILYAVNQPNIYKAQVLLAPASSSNGGGLSAMSRQLGGLASLAGFNIGGRDGTDKTTLALEVIKSRQFITDFIKKHDLLVPLMAGKGWDRAANELILDPELYDKVLKKWVRNVEPPVDPEPSLWEAHKKFRSMLSVSQSKDSGLITVGMENLSPFAAKQWVELLVKDINLSMKVKDLEEAKNSIAYLNSQLKNTQVTDMQNVFYQLIEEQTKTIMLSEVRKEYVFVTVDQAVVPEEKSKPRRSSICIVGSFLGMILGVFACMIRHYFKR